MPRLPQPGADKGNWGEILNDYLQQSHDESGQLKASSVGINQLVAGTISPAGLSGNYTDLAGKPTIPAAFNDQALATIDANPASAFRVQQDARQTVAVSAVATDAAAKYSDKRYAVTRRDRGLVRTRYRAMCNGASGGAGWTITTAQAAVNYTSSSSAYVTDYFTGGKCVRLVTLGAAGQAEVHSTLAAPVNLSATHVRITFKVVDANFTFIRIFAGTSSFSLVSTAALGFSSTGLNGKPVQVGRWTVLDVPLSKFSGTADWTAIQRVQVTVQDNGATPTEFLLHGLEFIERDPVAVNPKGAIAFTWDDSHPTQATVVLPALAARNLPATFYVIPGAHDTTASYMTTTQVLAIRDAGMDFGAHCYDTSTHALGLDALTSEQRINDFEQCEAWAQGLQIPLRTHAFPLGTHSAAAEVDVSRYWGCSRLAVSVGVNETITPARKFSLQAENITQGAATLTAAFTKARAEQGVVIVMGHSTVESGGDANAINAVTLNAILDAAVASGCDIITMSELANRMQL